MSAPAIGVRQRWSPGVNAQVDSSHPLAVGVLTALIAAPSGYMVDLTGLLQLAPQDSPAATRNAWGPAQANDNTQGANQVVGSAHPLAVQPPMSFMWVGSREGTPDDNCDMFGMLHNSTDANPWSSWMLRPNSSDWNFRSNDAGAPFSFPDSIGLGSLGPHVVIGVITPSLNMLYLDGVSGGTGGTRTAATISYTSTSTFIVSRNPAVGRPTNCSTNFGAAWNRALSVNEIARVSADPFCFLRR